MRRATAALLTAIGCVPFGGCQFGKAPRWLPETTTFAVVVEKPGANLRGLAAPGAGVVWASGSGGTVVRSLDGGRSWQVVGPAAAAAAELRAVVAWSADEALVAVAGQPAAVFRTTDGGRQWREVLRDPRPDAFFDALARHGDTVYLLGDPVAGAFCVWRSDDRGETWAAVPGHELPAPQPGEAAFAAGGQCLEADAGGVRFVTGGAAARLVQQSPDGGWHAQELPLIQGAPSQGAFAVASRSGACVVVGGDYRAPESASGTAAVRAAAGAFAPSTGPGLGYRSAVRWLDDQQVLAVGERGAGWSSDGGRSFQPFGSEGFHALAVAPDGAVFAAGSGGRVARLVRR